MEPPFDIEVEDLARRLGSSEAPLVLDIREPWEVRLCHLAGSRFVPMAAIPRALDALPGDRDIVVICHHGIRSRTVTAWLRAQGVARAINLRGGLDAWAARIDLSMSRY